MVSIITFDVNDEEHRQKFLYGQLLTLLENLTDQHRPGWGNLTSIRMVEHLTHTFDISLGKGEVLLPMVPALAEKRKKFLYNNVPTPHEVVNPLMNQKGFTFKFLQLDKAKQALAKSVKQFRDQKNADPEAIRFHPVFGNLNMMDWERAHYKHCYHHLKQFGLITSPGKFMDP